MAGSLNKVQLIGNLGRDPEVRQAQDGSKFSTFSIATSEKWRDKATNELRERTEWHRVIVFNEKLSELCEKYLKKGAKVYLEGQLQTRKWTDNTGAERYTTEVVLSRFRGDMVMLDGRNDNQAAPYPSGSFATGAPEPSFDIPSDMQGPTSSGSRSDLDDDIPF